MREWTEAIYRILREKDQKDCEYYWLLWIAHRESCKEHVEIWEDRVRNNREWRWCE